MEQQNREKDPKLTALEGVMREYAREDICLAFSGGVDSSLLLRAACDAAKCAGGRVYAVTFDTRLHPPCDLEYARRVAEELHAPHHVITLDELEDDAIRDNPPDRCYLCKKRLFGLLKEFAAAKGALRILDGTNEDDLHVYRPGIRALKELGIVSPLADLGVTKEEVKQFAAYYGMAVASRPSSPCMATRLPYHTKIDYRLLERIGEGEAILREMAGGNIRLRLHGEVARLELDPDAFETILNRRKELIERLKALGFPYITLDLEGFRSGSMDINL